MRRCVAFLPLAGPAFFWSVCAAQDFDSLAAAAGRAREAGRLEEATGLYREALALRSHWAEGWWRLGTLFYDRGLYEEAAAAFQKAAELSPEAGGAFVMLGLSEFRLGRKSEALQHLRRGRKLGVSSEPQLRRPMLYTEGLLLLEQGEFAQAQKALDELSREGLEQDDLIVALGMSVLGIVPGDQRTQNAAFLEMVRRAGRAQRLAALRSEWQQALRAYRQLAADYPKVRNVQFALGRFLLANHYDDQAVAAFRRELENSPNHLLARLGIAGVLARSDPGRGLPYAEEAVKLNPQLSECHYVLGLLLLETGQLGRAIAELETAERLSPEDARIYFALGRAYARAHRKEDSERARAAFQRLSRSSPEPF